MKRAGQLAYCRRCGRYLLTMNGAAVVVMCAGDLMYRVPIDDVDGFTPESASTNRIVAGVRCTKCGQVHLAAGNLPLTKAAVSWSGWSTGSSEAL
jgi:hypothetical protein